MLYICYKELDKRFAVVHGKKITKKARVEATILNNLTPLSKAEICKIHPSNQVGLIIVGVDEETDDSSCDITNIYLSDNLQ